jgi:hypothetical protein
MLFFIIELFVINWLTIKVCKSKFQILRIAHLKYSRIVSNPNRKDKKEGAQKKIGHPLGIIIIV